MKKLAVKDNELENPALNLPIPPLQMGDIGEQILWQDAKPLEFQGGWGMIAPQELYRKPRTLFYDENLEDKPVMSKEEEENSNLIRIDIDLAASALAKRELSIQEGEDTEMYPDYLEMYDKYYDILFKSKG